jgi:hypothetical protein
MENVNIMFKQLHFNVLRDGYQYRSVVIDANMVIIWHNYICYFDTVANFQCLV